MSSTTSASSGSHTYPRCRSRPTRVFATKGLSLLPTKLLHRPFCQTFHVSLSLGCVLAYCISNWKGLWCQFCCPACTKVEHRSNRFYVPCIFSTNATQRLFQSNFVDPSSESGDSPTRPTYTPLPRTTQNRSHKRWSTYLNNTFGQ